MGNFLACTSGAGAGGRPAKVVLPGGDTRKFEWPVSAAELMLDTPNHFVANAVGLQMGRRFQMIAADEELQLGGIYAMVPMRRLSSVVTPSDVAGLLMALAGKTPPPPEPETETEREGKLEKAGGLDEMQLRRYRMVRCASRKPELDTIAEESASVICSCS